MISYLVGAVPINIRNINIVQNVRGVLTRLSEESYEEKETSGCLHENKRSNN